MYIKGYKMLIDRVAKLAGRVVRGVTLTVGTVGEVIYNDIKSVPASFVDGLTNGEGLSKKTKTEVKSRVSKAEAPKDY